MWKKIIVGVLFVGLVVVLLVGAINRTYSKTRSSHDGNGEQEREQTGDGQGNQWGGNGNGNAGDDDASGESINAIWESFQGSIIDVTESELLFQMDSGEQFRIEGRAWSYAQDEGFLAQREDQIVVTGYYEDNEFKVGAMYNLTSGQSIVVRETGGRPMWAGGRRGGA